MFTHSFSISQVPSLDLFLNTMPPFLSHLASKPWTSLLFSLLNLSLNLTDVSFDMCLLLLPSSLFSPHLLWFSPLPPNKLPYLGLFSGLSWLVCPDLPSMLLLIGQKGSWQNDNPILTFKVLHYLNIEFYSINFY